MRDDLSLWFLNKVYDVSNKFMLQTKISKFHFRKLDERFTLVNPRDGRT